MAWTNQAHATFGNNERLQALRHLLLDDHSDLPWRIAGALVLLFGQPAERIAGLAVGQVKVEPDRRMLPPLLAALEFRCNNTAYRPVMQALDLLVRYATTEGKVRFYGAGVTVSVEAVVPKAWREAVVDEKGRVERIPYELCVLVALRDALRRRVIYVAGGSRWGNPEEDLPGDFEASREVHYAALRQPTDLTEFITGLQHRMGEALARRDRALVDGSAGGVKITTGAASRGSPCPSWSHCRNRNGWPRSRMKCPAAGAPSTCSTCSRTPTSSWSSPPNSCRWPPAR